MFYKKKNPEQLLGLISEISKALEFKMNIEKNQFWIFIGKTDAEAPIIWPSNVKKWLTGKDPEAGEDWR